MRRYLSVYVLAVGLMALPMAGEAMSFGSNAPESTAGPTYEEGRELALSGNFRMAIDKLQMVLDAEPKNADAWNMLGFSYRNEGKMDEAWDAYERALALDPNHKGAHEYLGEWYLMLGDLASAKAQQAKLEALCPSGCIELETLAKKVADATNS